MRWSYLLEILIICSYCLCLIYALRVINSFSLLDVQCFAYALLFANPEFFVRFKYSQRSSCSLLERLSNAVHSRLLLHIHLYADVYDSGNDFHVLTRRSPFRCFQRPFLSRLQCYCRSLLMLLLVEANRKTFS